MEESVKEYIQSTSNCILTVLGISIVFSSFVFGIVVVVIMILLVDVNVEHLN